MMKLMQDLDTGKFFFKLPSGSSTEDLSDFDLGYIFVSQMIGMLVQS